MTTNSEFQQLEFDFLKELFSLTIKDYNPGKINYANINYYTPPPMTQDSASTTTINYTCAYPL